MMLRKMVLPIFKGSDLTKLSIRLRRTLIAVGMMMAIDLVPTTRGTINVTGNKIRNYSIRCSEMLSLWIPVIV